MKNSKLYFIFSSVLSVLYLVLSFFEVTFFLILYRPLAQIWLLLPIVFLLLFLYSLFHLFRGVEASQKKYLVYSMYLNGLMLIVVFLVFSYEFYLLSQAFGGAVQ